MGGLVTQAAPLRDLIWRNFVLHLCRCFIGRLPSQGFPGIVVHPVLQLRQLPLRDFIKIRTLGEPAPDHPVVILVGPLFPCRVAVAVVYLRHQLFHFVVVQELAAVVRTQAPDA